MSTVYLVCPLSKPSDMTAAAQFGTLETINSRYVFGDEIIDGKMPQPFFDKLAAVAEYEFHPDRDYLALGGDHLQFACMSALLGAIYGSFRVLRYDRPSQGYVPVTISA